WTREGRDPPLTSGRREQHHRHRLSIPPQALVRRRVVRVHFPRAALGGRDPRVRRGGDGSTPASALVGPAADRVSDRLPHQPRSRRSLLVARALVEQAPRRNARGVGARRYDLRTAARAKARLVRSDRYTCPSESGGLTREDKFAKEGLTFDDVLLIPARSDILPTQVSTETRLTNEIRLDIPILSAAMDTVTDARLAIALGRLGGLGVIHRNLTISEQADEVRRAKDADVLVGAAVGVAGDADERAAALVAAGVDVIVVDTAHGHSAAVVRMVEKVKARHRVEVIAGNVATAEGTEELIAAGADCVKVAMGPGANRRPRRGLSSRIAEWDRSARWKRAAHATATARRTWANSPSSFPRASKVGSARSVHSRRSCTSSSAACVRGWVTRARPRSTICART